MRRPLYTVYRGAVPAWCPSVQTYSLYLRPPSALRHHRLGGEKARRRRSPSLGNTSYYRTVEWPHRYARRRGDGRSCTLCGSYYPCIGLRHVPCAPKRYMRRLKRCCPGIHPRRSDPSRMENLSRPSHQSQCRVPRHCGSLGGARHPWH